MNLLSIISTLLWYLSHIVVLLCIGRRRIFTPMVDQHTKGSQTTILLSSKSLVQANTHITDAVYWSQLISVCLDTDPRVESDREKVVHNLQKNTCIR